MSDLTDYIRWQEAQRRNAPPSPDWRAFALELRSILEEILLHASFEGMSTRHFDDRLMSLEHDFGEVLPPSTVYPADVADDVLDALAADPDIRRENAAIAAEERGDEPDVEITYTNVAVEWPPATPQTGQVDADTSATTDDTKNAANRGVEPSVSGFMAARGIFDWHEGDEPAEVTIRRLRDGADFPPPGTRLTRGGNLVLDDDERPAAPPDA